MDNLSITLIAATLIAIRPLTDVRYEATKHIKTPGLPDLIVISPMTRTLQTAMNAFLSILGSTPFPIEVQIWPDLREAHDANCNKGVSRAGILAKFPQFNFAECPEEWDHPPHTVEGATARAEVVRQRLKELSKVYSKIVLMTHRGFIAYLVAGERFEVCETRSYRFGTDEEAKENTMRFGVNANTKERHDFGPTHLVLYGICEESEGAQTTSVTVQQNTLG